MKTRYIGFWALMVLLASSAGPARAGTCLDPDERIADKAMVRLLPGANLDLFLTLFMADHPDVTVKAIDAIPGRPIHLLSVQVPPGYTELQLDQLEDDLELNYLTLIAWGEFLYLNEAPEGTTGSTFVDSPANASLFDNQYAKTITGGDIAQQRSQGAGVTVAILDTGVDTAHPALAGLVVPAGYDFIDNDADPSDVGDLADSDQDGLTDEMTGHGTFVAGLVTLIAPQTKILPVRVLDSDGNGDMWALAQGMFYAIDHGVEVMNVSISSTYKSQAVEDAVDEATALGIMVVAAAGNCNRDDPREFPAMGSDVIGVAATDDGDIKGTFSNYSELLFISAPGVMFFSGADPDPARSMISLLPDAAYAFGEGTSMAAPIVSGAVALIRSQHPEWPAASSVHGTICFLLEATATDIDALNPPYAGLLGAGRIDIGTAVSVGPPAPELGDLDADGTVGVLDLLHVLTDWGMVHTPADLTGDGMVDVLDLLMLLQHWS